MPLVKNRALVARDSLTVTDLDSFLKAPEPVLAAEGPIGVRLPSDRKVDDILPWLDRLDAVVLDFPKFGDGRHFTTARLLRERHGFTGEIRAVGQVLEDQIGYLRRCGFDAFEVPQTRKLQTYLDQWTGIEVVYQPAADDRTPISRLRLRGEKAA